MEYLISKPHVLMASYIFCYDKDNAKRTLKLCQHCVQHTVSYRDENYKIFLTFHNTDQFSGTKSFKELSKFW